MRYRGGVCEGDEGGRGAMRAITKTQGGQRVVDCHVLAMAEAASC